MLRIEVFIGSDRLDLFNDESVILNKSVKDYKELDKVFSDYTQSFTIPASKNNNDIMSHWYDESISTGFNPATKKAATIEINKLPFKSGFIWLNNAVLREGRVELYEISFFSEVPNLTSIFGKDTLPELGDSITQNLAYPDFDDAITDRYGAENDILIPLISTVRNWTMDGIYSWNSINANYYYYAATIAEQVLIPTAITDTNGRYNTSLNSFDQDGGTSGGDSFLVVLIAADPAATWTLKAYDAANNYTVVTGGGTGSQVGSAAVPLLIPYALPAQKLAFRFSVLPKCEFRLSIACLMGTDTTTTMTEYEYPAIGGLQYELKPALRAEEIIAAIESKYSLTFTSTFFASDAFRALYTYSNRAKGFGDHFYLDYTHLINGTEVVAAAVWDNPTGVLTIPSGSGEQRVTVVYNVLQSIFDEMTDTLPTPKVKLVAYDDVAGASFDYVYMEEGNEGNYEFVFPNSGTDYEIKFYVKSNFPELIDWTIISGSTYLNFLIQKERVELDNDSSCIFYFGDKAYTDSLTGESLITEGGLPAMKISDYLQGLIKQFNLVILPTGEDSFTIETYDYWMSQGVERNITPYVNIEEKQVRPAELFNQIDFKYEETSSILGETFRGLNGVGYGDLELEIRDSYGDAISSNTFELKLPFENPLWARLTDYAPQTFSSEKLSEIMTCAYVDKELSPMQGKAFNFYYADQINLFTNFDSEFVFRKFYREVADASETFHEYNLCFQYNTKNNSYTASLNFGSEVNPYTLTDGNASSPSLYNDYWSDWITDLYDLSMRRTILKAKLPVHLLLALNVNDSLIIGFSKYTINNMKVDITTGEAEFELLTFIP
jgi:hypothetical protein